MFLRNLVKRTLRELPNNHLKMIHSHSGTATKLVYSEYGDPIKVLQKCSEAIPELKPGEVLIKMLAAPVNPADINTIEGKYPSRPPLPAVPGNEGVGKVIEIGTDVTLLDVGDHVVPLTNALGTWRTHVILPSSVLLRVPHKLGLTEAATLTVNPCTAYRMLRDFTDLKPGDTVIQNGANSACGQYVIQIARAWGLRTVNVIRDRPDVAEVKDSLKQLGATHILTEEELRKTDLFKSGKLEKPRLGLNCVGGQSAIELTRHLQSGSPLVTYGGMSREPVTIPTSALIFKDLQIRGFWMTRWTKDNHDNLDRFEMFEELILMMTNNELRGPVCKMIGFDQYKEALENAMNIKGKVGKKYILEFNDN